MGHLFSRAFRRLTQCTSHARNQQHQHESNQQQDKDSVLPQVTTTVAESIPVGQSIDSAEYQALEYKDEPTYEIAKENEPAEQKQEQLKEDEEPDANKKQDVEDAVIKIQALVRGHLTRKALKDANQLQQNSPNALGQSHFDEESLTKNPPSAVFLPSSPLNIQQHQQSPADRAQLEPIAEVTETTTTTTKTTTKGEQDNSTSAHHLGRLEISRESSVDLANAPTSPTSPSSTCNTANASIDLDGICSAETPASASILISDHNMRPAGDKNLASVLYFGQNVTQSQQTMTPATTTTTTTQEATSSPAQVHGEEESESTTTSIELEPTTNGSGGVAGNNGDSEEQAAAIRIQSAFRGYRTRKNSPYRARSPNHSSSLVTDAANNTTNNNNNLTNENNLNSLSVLGQDGEEQEEEERQESVVGGGRRPSRPRRRDSSPLAAQGDLQISYKPNLAEQRIIQGAGSIDEFTTTEDTVREAASMHTQLQKEAEQTAEQASIRNEDLEEEATLSSIAAQLEHSIQQQQQQQRQAIDQSQSNTLDECGLSGSLNTTQTTNAFSSTNLGALDGVLATSNGLPRASIGTTKSDVSMDLDTDSSFLGAALSLNETTTDLSVGNALATEATQEEFEDEGEQASFSKSVDEPIEELTQPTTDEEQIGVKSDNNYEDELEREGRNLIRQLEGASDEEVNDDYQEELAQNNRDECALEEEALTNQLEPEMEVELKDNDGHKDDLAIEEELATATEASLLLNENEQHAIELESDDIERRDPRGHATEDRAKSPLIKEDQLVARDFKAAHVVEEPQSREEENLERLNVVEQLESAFNSGRSSPALCSSNGAESSSNSNSNNEDSGDEKNNVDNNREENGNRNESTQEQQQQQQTRQQQTASRNRKRNNRNKKKNKK